MKQHNTNGNKKTFISCSNVILMKLIAKSHTIIYKTWFIPHFINFVFYTIHLYKCTA